MANNRKIFEEVGDSQTELSTKTVPAKTVVLKANNSGIRIFLIILFLLVIGMVAVGGLTRQTDSGLSITVWEPIRGAIPPLSSQDWNNEFEKYKDTAEFELINSGMTIKEFKVIFWWEWGHRQLGRFVGLVFVIGFSWLYFTKQLNRTWSIRLLALGGLGLFQGFIGWWMVASGLRETTTDVASYRLATHLTISILILSLIYWNYLKTKTPNFELLQAKRFREQKLEIISLLTLVVLFMQGILGALMAGIDAGGGFPTWPMMNGEVIPSNSFDYSPWYTNFTQNPSLVHFNHRMFGYLLVGLAVWVFFQTRKSSYPNIRKAGLYGKIAVIFQILVGVVTVLTSVQMIFALLHQLSAILIICIYINLLFFSRYPPQQSITRAT